MNHRGGKNGWAIEDGRVFRSRAKQNRYDAECNYDLLERKVVPKFYKCYRAGMPKKWLRMARASMRCIPAGFSSHRMLADYLEGYYFPTHFGGDG